MSKISINRDFFFNHKKAVVKKHYGINDETYNKIRDRFTCTDPNGESKKTVEIEIPDSLQDNNQEGLPVVSSQPSFPMMYNRTGGNYIDNSNGYTNFLNYRENMANYYYQRSVDYFQQAMEARQNQTCTEDEYYALRGASDYYLNLCVNASNMQPPTWNASSLEMRTHSPYGNDMSFYYSGINDRAAKLYVGLGVAKEAINVLKELTGLINMFRGK